MLPIYGSWHSGAVLLSLNPSHNHAPALYALKAGEAALVAGHDDGALVLGVEWGVVGQLSPGQAAQQRCSQHRQQVAAAHLLGGAGRKSEEKGAGGREAKV